MELWVRVRELKVFREVMTSVVVCEGLARLESMPREDAPDFVSYIPRSILLDPFLHSCDHIRFELSHITCLHILLTDDLADLVPELIFDVKEVLLL